jgi:hypothetical protein
MLIFDYDSCQNSYEGNQSQAATMQYLNSICLKNINIIYVIITSTLVSNEMTTLVDYIWMPQP